MFAKWVVCNTRRLRISNVPTYGSAGIYRQAGPLSAHTAAQMEKVGEEIVNDVEELEQQGHQRGRRCGFSAQALEKVEKDKDKLKKTSRPGAETSAVMMELTTEETRKKRGGEKTAEQR